MSTQIDHTVASLVGSAASNILAAIVAKTGINVPRPAVINHIVALYDRLVNEYVDDETGWEQRPMPGQYDIYLEIRRESGTVTAYDLVRRGLAVEDFTDGVEFNKHNMRVAESRMRTAPQGCMLKECSSCGQLKDRAKFPRAGGSKCKTCVDRSTRSNRKQRESI